MGEQETAANPSYECWTNTMLRTMAARIADLERQLRDEHKECNTLSVTADEIDPTGVTES